MDLPNLASSASSYFILFLLIYALITKWIRHADNPTGLSDRDGAEQGRLVPDGRLHAAGQVRRLLLHLLRRTAQRHAQGRPHQVNHLLKVNHTSHNFHSNDS